VLLLPPSRRVRINRTNIINRINRINITTRINRINIVNKTNKREREREREREKERWDGRMEREGNVNKKR